MRRRLLLRLVGTPLVGVLLAGLTHGAAVANEPDRPDGLRVANFNIHAAMNSDDDFSPKRTAKAIKNLDADVVALQEVDVNWDKRSEWKDVAANLAKRLGMEIYFGEIYRKDPPGEGKPVRRFGNALLSKHPIVASKNHEITRLSSQEPDPEPKFMPGFPQITITVHGRKVQLYSTHLDVQKDDPKVRAAQVHDMLKVMDRVGGRQILMGDFNTEADAPELKPLWSTMDDTWAEGGSGKGNTYPATAPETRIDFALATKDFAVEGASVPETLASDHRPVVTDLSWR